MERYVTQHQSADNAEEAQRMINAMSVDGWEHYQTTTGQWGQRGEFMVCGLTLWFRKKIEAPEPPRRNPEKALVKGRK